MAIHVRWDPPEGSTLMTPAELGAAVADVAAAKQAIEQRYPAAFYSEALPGLVHIGVQEIIHVWKDQQCNQRGARAVAWIVQTSW